MFEKFADYMYSLLFTPLKKARKTANQFYLFFKITGTLFDDTKQDILRVREESMVISASEVMLPEHGKDRNMPRLLGESAEGYRRRLSMKAIIAEKAGTREGILLALAALGYENAEIKSYRDIDPDRWAEFIVALGAGNGQAVRDLAVIYQEILLVKQASSKPAYLLFTDNEPLNDTLTLGTDVTSYTERILNDADDLVLVQDREFDFPLYAAVEITSYSEKVLNDADDLILCPDRSFDFTLNISIVPTSYREEHLQ